MGHVQDDIVAVPGDAHSGRAQFLPEHGLLLVHVVADASAGDSTDCGTDEGAVDGRLSEYLVAGLLWDLFDVPTSDDDGYAVPLERLFTALFEQLPGRESDQGARGVDLSDFLYALQCGAQGVDVESICIDRQISSLVPVCQP